MRYSIQNGLSTSWHDRLTDNKRFSLPLVAILILALILGIRQATPTKTPPKPLTLGIYTIKSPPDNGNKNSPQSSSGGSQTNSAEQPAIATAASPASPITIASGSSGLIGGMGGGLEPAGSTGSVPSGGGSGGSPSTFPCVDITSGLSVTCTYQACTPAIALLSGQKALITTSGTCAVVN